MKTTLFDFSKKIFAMILVLVMALCSTETIAFAFENTEQDPIYFNENCTNPLYDETANTKTNSTQISGSFTNGVRYATNAEAQAKKDAAIKVRNNMINRKTKFTIDIKSARDDYADLVDEIFDLAISKDLADTPTAGDYLAWQYEGYSYTGSAEYDDDGKIDYTFNFKVDYYTTADQEKKVTEAVDKALDAMNLDNLSDYAKIKKIYDYICKVCDYDHSTSADKTKFTAYAAIIKNEAVCQGYSTLLYRMLEEVGIDNKIVTSTDHSWNIVEIDGKYYNVDVTWDDDYYDEGYNYFYFLVCPAHFTNHVREAKFKTAAFNNKYVMTDKCHASVAKTKATSTPCSNVEAKVTVATAKAPTLTAIADGFTAKWVKVTGATGYQLQYATQSNFANAATVTIASADTVTKTVTGRGYDNKYYVRVRAYKKVNGVITYGDWSTAKNVTTPAMPKKVTIKALIAASKAFTVEWNKVTGATGYQIQYAANSNFKDATTVNATADATSKKITNKAAKKKYYVRVRAFKKVNGTYVYGSWSTVKDVTTK
ncbi:MAG: hypothetical protein J1E81_04230 [Eubacterium sp.]|nr:hypothetical protein [Eubacterium sp.]